jgi:hypothetical protein
MIVKYVKLNLVMLGKRRRYKFPLAVPIRQTPLWFKVNRMLNEMNK